MSRRDYQAIAQAIYSMPFWTTSDDAVREVTTKHNIVTTLAEVMQADNPRFDKVRFYKACGYTE